MYQAHHPQDKKSAVSNLGNQGSKQNYQFKDNKAEHIAQRKLQLMAHNSQRRQVSMQLKSIANSASSQLRQSTNAGSASPLPDNLKAGIESLSGYSMDSVKVHYHSDRPAQLNAVAYAQGEDIYVAPGQEKHLPHESWHVVQQKQGRVKATRQLKSVQINDDRRLESEADLMGSKALKVAPSKELSSPYQFHDHEFQSLATYVNATRPIQREETETEKTKTSLITEGGQVVSPDQMDKISFLNELENKTAQLADNILAKIGQTSKGCPYISKWFEYYRKASAEDIERAIALYAPSAKTAATAKDIISAVLNQVTVSLTAQVSVGLDEVDESNPMELTNDGKLVKGINPPDVAQLGCCTSSNPKSDLIDAKKRYREDPSEKNLSNWKDEITYYFQTTKKNVDEEYREFYVARDEFNLGNDISEADEEKAMNAMVENSGPMNKYLTQDEKEDEDPYMEKQYKAFKSAMKKLKPVIYKELSSQASRVPGMDESCDLSSLKIGEEYIDPIIRFYGEGLVGKGKFEMRVQNLEAYDFTDVHTNKGYDEAVAYGKEEQIITLPGTKLKLIEIHESDKTTVIIYEFVSMGKG